jgi:hypothetical protein
MLDENIVVGLSENILKRYEHNLQDGILFLYNVETQEIWTGNNSSNDLIKLLDKKSTLKEIYTALQPFFEDYGYDVIKDSFDFVIEELIQKNFLEIVCR